MKSFAGFDIGGTKIEAVLCQNDQVVSRGKIMTPKHKSAFLNAISSLVVKLGGDASTTISGAGFGVAAAIDRTRGIILNSPNLKFLNGMRFVSVLERKLGLPVRLDNDVNAFLLGEHLYGQARGKKNVVALTIGTGLGGAVMESGKILRGRVGAAGELGHILIVLNEKQVCSLEDLVSSQGFARLGAKDVFAIEKMARAGNRKAKNTLAKIGEYLGTGLGSLVNIFNPELIILGGGLMCMGEFFLPNAVVTMEKRAIIPKKHMPRVCVSRLDGAGALGAAALFGKGANL